MRAIGYARVSTDKQADSGVSLEAQQEKIRAMAVVQGAALLDLIVDAGESAKSLDRPGMERLLSLVDARRVDTVIIAKLDRLTRSVKDLALLLERFTRRGVALVSVAESLDTGTWRSLVKATAKRAGDAAAEEALKARTDPEAARRSAMKPFTGFRFHDLRHQSITEMAEAGVPGAAMQSIAGHLSKKMLDHYSHVRQAAKRQAVETLGGGLITPEPDVQQAKGKAN